jgi:hypothetical protein
MLVFGTGAQGRPARMGPRASSGEGYVSLPRTLEVMYHQVALASGVALALSSETMLASPAVADYQVVLASGSPAWRPTPSLSSMVSRGVA